MNRAINLLLLVISFPTMAFAIIVGFDLPIEFLHTTGEQLEHREIIFICFAALSLILILRRSASRWVGVGMTRKPERFIWCTDIGQERKKQVRMYLIIEAVIALIFALAIYRITSEAWPIAVVYGLLFLDQLVFLLIAMPWFRVGVTHKAVVVADREVKVLYFSGLRRVESHQQTIYFEYIEELQLFFPTNCLPEGKYGEFREALETRVNRDRVYFSDKFKELS
ncbi:MAG: hypothetical protein A3D31_11815 [Candidatus Fluviicola riflensis]|nr:MAG: hypothetical protein CHH17_16245 [Candidatus Fluviicola riflensis]OGS77673.1 MAG: hypothetical protein A3D31_11815 [Candidatus Fluviicola riflensis]OGS84256.1 MAG: hypothetical protein A3E30_13225 [Fluviicola sp. RIFCSPHIGHO2_12_FULL_43_24]OGS84739.1 MAG: hypothetical protein A2724_08750 [Fluviicola sp. RIFCSPHIGHO2_01_FULL_43_53]